MVVYDPNNTGGVTEQELAQALSTLAPHHHHHHHSADAGGSADGTNAEDPLEALLQAIGAPATSASAQGAQNLFSQIDTNGDGSISQSELEQAVTAAGG